MRRHAKWGEPTCAIAALIAIAIASATACTLTPDGGAGFATGATSASAGNDDDDDATEADADASEGDASEAGDGSGGESSGGSSAGATTNDPSDASASAGEGEASGDASTAGDPTAGQEGPACGQPGDTIVQGSTGPANANQNCPTTTYTAVVAGSPGMVSDIEVLLDATVATTSEFTATLQSPSGTAVVLFDQHGGVFSDDFIDTYFDDASLSPIAAAAAPRSGCFAPDQTLAAFVGDQAGGTWTLTVQTCLYAVNVDAWELRISH